MKAPSVLEVDDIGVTIHRGPVVTSPVDGVSFQLRRGECLGLVGESGSGKSLTLRAILGLLPHGGRLAKGQIRVAPDEHSSPVPMEPEAVRGHHAAMVFQEPASALNPVKRVGDLIAEGPRAIHGLSRSEARRRAVTLMREVGIPDPDRRARAWPHQLSGGLRQRVAIAMALAAEPRVLLCDEPTTAVDVTIQDQILGLLDRIRREQGVSIVFVTHDLAVIGQIANRVAVMYAGRIVEEGPIEAVYPEPAHPYTLALLRSIPAFERTQGRLEGIGGRPPDPRSFPLGCRFHPRCPYAQPDCLEASYVAQPIAQGRSTACIHHSLLAGERGVDLR